MSLSDELEAVFWEFSESFGLSDSDFPNSNYQSDQCEFEDKFKAILCRHKGHKLIPDQCGMMPHDFCGVCNVRREEIEKGVVTNCRGEVTKNVDKPTSFISDDFRNE